MYCEITYFACPDNLIICNTCRNKLDKGKVLSFNILFSPGKLCDN